MKMHDIKVGDYVLVNYEGDIRRGEVVEVNNEDKQACVDNGVQEFWYELNQISPLPLDENELVNLKFHKTVNDDGTVKYSKGAFRMLIPKEGDFSRMEIWYRDETRHITEPLTLNELQNHYHAMTKVHLNDQAFD